MKNLPCKDHLIYLLLSGVLVFAGAMFTDNVISYNDFILESKIITGILLVVNALITYVVVDKLYGKNSISFCISLLYLFSPTHFDAFIYQFQLQSILSESMLLGFFYYYLIEKMSISLLFLLISILLNTKMLMVTFFVYLSNKFSRLEKILTCSVSAVILVFLVPIFSKNILNLGELFKSVMLIAENLIYPFGFKILDLSILSPEYYGKIQVFSAAVLVLVMVGFAVKNKNTKIRVLVGFVLIAFFQALLPLKQIVVSEEYLYFYLPTLHPFVLFSFLFVLAHFFAKYDSFKKTRVVFVSSLCAYWLSANLIHQSNFQNITNEWSYAFHLLPNEFNHEKDVKLLYTRQIIASGQDEDAEKIINENKDKFPDLTWYSMLLGIAARENNSEKSEKIYDQLRRSQIPYENSSYE